MIRSNDSGGTLGPTIWFFVACVFYLLPVVVLSPYIGGWAWLVGIAFWVGVFFSFKYAAKRRSKRDERDQ